MNQNKESPQSNYVGVVGWSAGQLARQKFPSRPKQKVDNFARFIRMTMNDHQAMALPYIRSKKLRRPEKRDMPLAARLSSLVDVELANKLALEFVLVDHPHMSPVVVAVVDGAEHVSTSDGLTIWTASTLIFVELKQFFSFTSGTSDKSSVKTMSAH